MKTWMKTAIAAALIATTGLAAGAAVARGCDGEGPRGAKAAWHQMEPGQMQERAAERLDSLEKSLAIRAEQREAWDTFRQSMEARAVQAAEHMAARRGAERPGNVLERMQRMEEMGQVRLEMLSETREAVEALYSTLDEKQQQTFDEQFRMGRHGREGGRRGGMRHGSMS